MYRFVSSANLAVEWVRARHGPRPGDLVVITHTDCDSVLSSGIVSGRLEPKPEYEAAAIAADHTGERTASPIYCSRWIVVAITSCRFGICRCWNEGYH